MWKKNLYNIPLLVKLSAMLPDNIKGDKTCGLVNIMLLAVESSFQIFLKFLFTADKFEGDNT